MTFVGCDLHTRTQQVAVLDTRTGEVSEHQLVQEGPIKAEVSCPENTEVRCPLFTDGRVRSGVMRGPPPPRRRPAWTCGPAAPPSSFRGADSCPP
jgi:hypothetical protein